MAGLEVVAFFFKFHSLFAVEPMLNLTVIVNDPGSIPFTCWVYFLIGRCCIHIIVAASFLFVADFAFPSTVVKQLKLRPGLIVILIFGIFYHVINNSTVPSRGKFIIQRQLE